MQVSSLGSRVGRSHKQPDNVICQACLMMVSDYIRTLPTSYTRTLEPILCISFKTASDWSSAYMYLSACLP